MRWTGFLALASLPAISAGCSGSSPSEGRDPSAPLRISVLPGQSEAKLREIHDPLIAYLERTTGIELELSIPSSYDDLLAELEQGNVQLGWFGGLTFLQAEQAYGFEALVMRDVDLEFTSDFLVRVSSSGDSIEDFAQKAISFGPALSTSGSLMPRHYLEARGIEPEEFFSAIRHSTAHDETATLVQEGEVDVGALSSLVVQQMFEDGRLSDDLVRILWRTPPYRDYVFAVTAEIEPDLKQRLRDAFMSLDAADPEHAKILRALGAGGFLPASRRDYEELRVVAERRGFLGGDLP